MFSLSVSTPIGAPDMMPLILGSSVSAVAIAIVFVIFVKKRK
ncbi:MAG: hypothetical protein ACW992_07880 [Candidatus Thorarchaeota archaeon]